MKILVDCSFVNFAQLPTGISRVTLNYLEVAFDWGRINGIEVLPVTPAVDYMFLVEPLPGSNPPEYLRSRIRYSPGLKALIQGRRFSRKGLIYTKDIVHHAL